MRVTVLRSFPFSRDGVKTEQAVKGEIVDLPDGMVEGLVVERFVSAILPEPALTANEARALESLPPLPAASEPGVEAATEPAPEPARPIRRRRP